MSSLIKIGHVIPFINCTIVNFSSVWSFLDIFPWSSYNDISLIHSATRVSMARVPHSGLVFKDPSSVPLDQQFHREHRVRELVKISSANHIGSRIGRSNLDCLVIMWVANICLNCIWFLCVISGIIYVEFLRVFLKYIHLQIINLGL
jgi:hypothetical protein